MCSIGDDGVLCLAKAIAGKYDEMEQLNVSGGIGAFLSQIGNDISEEVKEEVKEQLKSIVLKIDI